jgi:uncharacterized repeat protein (TIGR01451 family)
VKQQRVLLILLLSAGLLLIWTGHSQGYIANPVRSTPIAPQVPVPVAATRQAREVTRAVALPSALHAPVDPALLKQAIQGDAAPLHFIVEMAKQADLSRQPAALEKVDGRTWLVNTLQTTAEASQAQIRAELAARRSRGQVVEYRPFWIFNGLAIVADADTLLALAARPDVRFIRQDLWQRWIDSAPQVAAPSPASPDSQLPQDTAGVAWNIARVRADLVWSALGLDGSGVTVAIMDTGVDWQHPALQSQYRGYKPGGMAIHEGNWLCTTDEGYLYPVDGYGHGTHVAGIAVGSRDATGQAIGMAPGARWIAVKMLNNFGYGYTSWIHAAFEWLLAPAGDPALAPDVVNGSWGSASGADQTFRADLQALRAAGIVPVFAAGNEGPFPSSVGSPASYPEAIAVGATDDLDRVTSFSSRGPSHWGEIKPELAAPGAQIRSALPGGTYGTYNGTSQATPHVTGLVALLLQADPTLTVDGVEAILTSTAVPLGDSVPNNDTGWGRIDAYQAAAVALKAGFVAGRVTRYPDQEPLPAAQITVYNDLGERQATVQTDDTGLYRVALPPGPYDVTATAFGYAPQTMAHVAVQAALTTTVDVVLSPLPSGALWGQVTDAETGGPVQAELAVVGTPAHTSSDPQTGAYSLALPAGTYTLQLTRNGYRRHTTSDLEVVADQATRLDVALDAAPTLLLVDSGRRYYDSQASYFEQALDDRDYVYDLWEIRDLTTDLPDLADLGAYQITIWSSPQDAPGLIGAGDVISDYLSTGGNLFLTGQDIGYWDDGLSGWTWHEYYERFLKARAVADNAGRGDLVGAPGQLLHDLSLTLNGPDSAGNQLAPDSITLLDGREAAIIGNYADDGGAAVSATGCQSYRAVYLAAGLEGLGDRSSRAEVMDRTLTWLASPRPAVDVELYPPRQDQVWLTGRSVTYTVELRNTGQFTDRFALELAPSAWVASTWNSTFSQPISQSTALGPCQTQIVGLKVTVPPDVAWNTTDAVTLTARSLANPARIARAEFHTKAPAPILLVDNYLAYDTVEGYQAALGANSLPYDLWNTDQPQYGTHIGPSLQRLRRYPVVVWFTAYNWHRTLTPDDEARLAAYLDGGGRLLLSSQDYLYTSGFTDFARHYLGVASYRESMTTTQTVGTVGSPVGDGLGPMDLAYPFRNWSDALRPSPDARPAFWGQHGQPAALTRQQPPWKTAFFAFPLEAYHAQDMATVLGRTVAWLSPLGDSSLAADRRAVIKGEQLGYTLQMRNTGPALLSNVWLSNTLPLSTTYVSGSLEGPAQYDPATGRFTWNGALAPGDTVTIRYRLHLDALLPDGAIVRNAAHLSDESGLGLDLAAVSRVNTPDLSASVKAVKTEVVHSTHLLTYTMTLHNDGLRPTQASLDDPIPLRTVYVADSAWASSGLLTSTADALWWTGSISTGQIVTITFPVWVLSPVGSVCILNRASLDDGWGGLYPLEAFTWVDAYLFLPLVFKHH